MWLAAARLTALLTAIGLATSRLGLIAHELVGHGGTAVALGGEIREVRLFWFAGGWIRYDFAIRSRETYLACALGGLVLEAVIGVALWLALARSDRLAARLVRGAGAALVVHATWYFATGTWHGYGDGALVHRVLGDARYPVAIAAGALAIAAAFLGARLVLGALAHAIPGGRVARAGGLALAALVAGGIQVGLAVGEVRLRQDASYRAIMKPERERAIARELAAWQREQARLGLAISEAERAAQARRLAANHTEPPFRGVLGVLLAAAVIAGAWRARPPTDPPTRRHLAVAAALAAASIGLVIAIDLGIH